MQENVIVLHYKDGPSTEQFIQMYNLNNWVPLHKSEHPFKGKHHLMDS